MTQCEHSSMRIMFVFGFIYFLITQRFLLLLTTKQIALCTETDEKTNKYTEKWRGIVVDTEHKFSPPKRSRTFSHLFAKKMVK